CISSWHLPMDAKCDALPLYRESASTYPPCSFLNLPVIFEHVTVQPDLYSAFLRIPLYDTYEATFVGIASTLSQYSSIAFSQHTEIRSITGKFAYLFASSICL